jgi:hypothetical protein
MTEAKVSVFDEARLHELRKAGYREIEIVRDEAGHEFLILAPTMDNFIREVAKGVGPLGAAWMMHGETGQRGQAVGLNFFEFYVLGRGGALGGVDAKDVVKAFYFFEPERLTETWNTAREKMSPPTCAQHYADACAEFGRARISDVADLNEFGKLAERVIAASTTNGALFTAWREMPLPDDAPGRAMLFMNVLREMRGGAHIEATKELGLDRKVALITNSPHMYQLFGWTDEPPATDREAADRAEDLTDELETPAFAVLDAGEREVFARVVGAISQATS